MKTALTVVLGFAAFLLTEHAAAQPGSPPRATIAANKRGEPRVYDDGR